MRETQVEEMVSGEKGRIDCFFEKRDMTRLIKGTEVVSIERYNDEGKNEEEDMSANHFLFTACTECSYFFDYRG